MSNRALGNIERSRTERPHPGSLQRLVLEAPLKFRAPGVTLQVGLGIGRLVFRALNASR